MRAGGSWASVWTDVRVWPERECGPGRPACTTQCRGLQCVPPCWPPVMCDKGAVTTPDGPHDPWDVGTAGYEAGCGPESCHCVQTLTPCSTGCGVWQVCAPEGAGGADDVTRRLACGGPGLHVPSPGRQGRGEPPRAPWGPVARGGHSAEGATQTPRRPARPLRGSGPLHRTPPALCPLNRNHRSRRFTGPCRPL